MPLRAAFTMAAMTGLARRRPPHLRPRAAPAAPVPAVGWRATARQATSWMALSTRRGRRRIDPGRGPVHGPLQGAIRGPLGDSVADCGHPPSHPTDHRPRRRLSLAGPLVLLFLGMLGGCAQLGPGEAPEHGPLPEATRRALAAAGVAPGSLAAVALPLGHRGQAWGHRAGAPMQPGSTMKLVTSVVALDRLGPGHRGHTTFTSDAPLVEGVLRGDLRLEGGADPELGIAAFWALLVELRAAGVQRIAGDLVIDRHLFSPARPDLGAPPFDEGPEWGYNVIPDALGLAGALLPVEIDSRGGPVRARTVPPLAGIEVLSRMALADRRCADWEDDWQPPKARDEGATLVVELHGAFPRDCMRRIALQVPDRLRLEEAIFRTLWAGLGGALDGQVREAPAAGTAANGTANGAASGTEATPPASRRTTRQASPHTEPQASPNMTTLAITHTAAGMAGAAVARAGSAAAHAATHAAADMSAPSPRILARREARPWGEVLRRMNKVSDNAQTRLLYLALGAAEAGAAADAPTAARAERVVRQWFDSHGIAAPGLVLDNGSGLSRSERITPLALARLLQVAWSGRHASELVASLPLAGEDGTLRARLRDSPATGWARLKTGTLRDVAALAGYVRDAAGRPWAVAMMVNHERARAARPALDALVDALARSEQPGAWVETVAAGAVAQPSAAGEVRR